MPAFLHHTKEILVLPVVHAVAVVVVREGTCPDVGGVGPQPCDRHLGEIGIALGELGLEIGEHAEQVVREQDLPIGACARAAPARPRREGWLRRLAGRPPWHSGPAPPRTESRSSRLHGARPPPPGSPPPRPRCPPASSPPQTWGWCEAEQAPPYPHPPC